MFTTYMPVKLMAATEGHAGSSWHNLLIENEPYSPKFSLFILLSHIT